MREYEGLIIIDPNKEGSIKEITDSITSGIKAESGKINKEENWGKQRLAYPIRKHQEAIHYKLDFSIDPAEIKGLTASYRLNPDILRVMITAKK